MKVLVLGSRGIVGHVMGIYFAEHGHEVIGYDTDITHHFPSLAGSFYNLDEIEKLIADESFDAVINCTAVINQHAEEDKAEASFINGFLPHFLERITKGTKTIVFQRSTDCIFSGKKGRYTVNDTPDAESFYAKTKVIGELINEKDITVRTSLIGPETDECSGESLLNWFVHQEGSVNGFAGAMWTGVTTLEFAKLAEKLISLSAHGLFQYNPSYAISKYELLKLFEKYFPKGRTINKVDGTTADKSLVPELCGIDLKIPDYEEMIAEMKAWVLAHEELYKDYI